MRVTKLRSTTPSRVRTKPSSLPSDVQPWKPSPYMLKSVRFLLNRGAAALFLDPGMGKTSISYAAVKVLRNEKMLKGALVLAPLRPATSTWPEEQRIWKEFNDLDVVVLHGPHKERLVKERHDVYVINFEGLAWLINSGALRDLFKKGWLDTLIIDELSKFKHSKTQRYKLLTKWLHRFTRRWGLTGSPAANSLMNLFSQAFMLDMGTTFGPFFSHFRVRYFTPVGDYGWELQAGADELIYKHIAPLALRLEAEDYMVLPEFVPVFLKFDLPTKTRKLYDEMEDEYFSLLDSGERLSAVNAGVAQGKCRQIASGAVYRNAVDPITGEVLAGKTKEWIHMHDEKLEILEDLIDELQGQQLLIAYEFGHDRQRIQEQLKKMTGMEVPYIGGGVSTKKALAYEKEWNSGRMPLMLGHAQSMGHGLNFQKGSAHHIFWFTTTWDYENYDQFNRRLRRRGNKASKVFVYHPIARRTVEEGVVVKLARKRKRQDNLFAAIKSYAHDRGYQGRLKLK
jgi:SNF2 family DNA or RNA helicase